MYKQPTFARPASMQFPAVWARSSDKGKIMKEYGLGYWFQHQRNIPQAWPRIREWPVGANIGKIISVIQTGAGVSGPTRTMLPERVRHASNISGDSIFALDSHKQAQPPQAEQPQRTREEPYFNLNQRPILNAIRMRLRRT